MSSTNIREIQLNTRLSTWVLSLVEFDGGDLPRGDSASPFKYKYSLFLSVGDHHRWVILTLFDECSPLSHWIGIMSVSFP